jgi:hypothetical protein
MGFAHAATRAGNLQTLQWLRENNCPWNGLAIAYILPDSMAKKAIAEWLPANHIRV